MLQLYQRLSTDFNISNAQKHPLFDVIYLFNHIETDISQQANFGIMMELLIELGTTIEFLFSKIDYLYRKLPNQQYIQSLSYFFQQNNENQIAQIGPIYTDLCDQEYWKQSHFISFGNNFAKLHKDALEGTCLISTTFVKNSLEIYVEGLFNKFTQKVFYMHEEFRTRQYIVGIKLVRILKIMLNKFKFLQHEEKKLVLSNQDDIGSQALLLKDFVKTLNKIKLKEFFFDVFDIYIDEDVFFGKTRADSQKNQLGIDNRLWTTEVIYTKNSNLSGSAYLNNSQNQTSLANILEESLHEF